MNHASLSPPAKVAQYKVAIVGDLVRIAIVGPDGTEMVVLHTSIEDAVAISEAFRRVVG